MNTMQTPADDALSEVLRLIIDSPTSTDGAERTAAILIARRYADKRWPGGNEKQGLVAKSYFLIHCGIEG